MTEPGCLNHARWLTSNRILCLYVSTLRPSAELVIIVKFLLKVHVPQCFSIKKQKSVKDGARHFFNTIRLSRYLSVENLKIIDAVISRNAFFALPENILLSMISDEQISIRQDALKKILEARQTAKDNEQPTSSPLPMINFNATHYGNMIDWSKVEIISQPVLRKVTNEKLVHSLSMDNVFDN